MAVSILQPKNNKESALDKVLKGVEVANDVLGIYSDIRDIGFQSDIADSKKKQADLEQKRFERESAGLSVPELQQYKDIAGINVPPDMPRYQVEKTYGDLAQYVRDRKKFENQKQLADLNRQNKPEFELLPREKQKQVELFAIDIANKTAINNEIKSALQILKSPDVSEDQKIQAGLALAKVMNSTQGKDAVGVEEAKRVTGLLERVNFVRGGNPLGRRLGDFIDQLGILSSRLDNSAERNRNEISRLYGRPADRPETQDLSIFAKEDKPGVMDGFIPESFANNKQKLTTEDFEIYNELLKNPNHPKADQLKNILKSKGLNFNGR